MSLEIALPFETRSVAEGRRLVAAALPAEGIDAAVGDDLALAIAELLGNAIRHGSPRADGTVGLTLAVTADAVEVAVADGGTGPQFPTGDPLAGAADERAGDAAVAAEPRPGGYGLLIAAALGDLLVDRSPDGTRVSVRIRRPQSAGKAGTDGLLSLR